MFKWLGRFLRWLGGLLRWLGGLFGGLLDSNDKELKRIQSVVDSINKLEPDYTGLSDDDLRGKTIEFKARLSSGASLDELLPEAYAAVREAARRSIGQRHYDVQLMGGIVLHQGKIAEMRTGEGKTLVATLSLYLNSLAGKGCHLVTVNDYLARRDPYWMGPVYSALGVSVASIFPDMPDEHLPSRLYDPAFDSGDKRWPHFRPVPRKEAYKADITYGTSSDFGFDYLRDNMVVDSAQYVQRPVSYAIVDEVDYLLIDEARTPLIISGQAEESSRTYQTFARLVPNLRQEEDFTIDEKSRSVSLTENGINHMENILKRENLLKSPNLYDPANFTLTRHLDAALKAEALYKKDREYVVTDTNPPEIVIVDEFTGRLMFGRRYSEGLHQAIEAKENVHVQPESMTFATITIQNYFRMYEKLAGMTGTALTEAEEFSKIYNLEVVVIPTNKPAVRQDFADQIYKDETAKYKAVAREIEEMHKSRRPVLIGTVSIEKSQELSNQLMRRGIQHQILNAKLHEKEANIIAQAGEPGAVTVATNMAGRGVDIILGGNPQEGQDKVEWQKKHDQVVGLGGLHVIGTERHEARRIDNQLRGRAGRQGDPGSSRFYISLEDDIMRRFGGDRIKGLMERLGLDEETPIENSLINRIIDDVQKRVEGYNFDIRKNLVEYDDVINKQREIIYAERKKILSGADLKANILGMVKAQLKVIAETHSGDEQDGEHGAASLAAEISTVLPLPPSLDAVALGEMSPKDIEERLNMEADALYALREKDVGAENMRLLERIVMLRTIDNLWIEHLTNMEQMRQSAGLESFGQRDPLVVYKTRGHEQFQVLLDTIQSDVARVIFRVRIERQEAPRPQPVKPQLVSPMAQIDHTSNRPVPKGSGKKVGRNDPCPCGSGKKYKHCCGQ